MRKLILATFTLAIVITGCQKTTQPKVVEEVPVQVYVVHPDTISRFILVTGTLEAYREALVYSKVSERLESISVHTGQWVDKNQLLGEQHNQLLQAAVRQAQAALDGASAQYQLAQSEFERIESLQEEHAVSAQQFDQARTQFEAAKAAKEQAEAALHQARVQLENTQLRAPFAGQVAMILFDEADMVPAGQPVFKIVDERKMVAKLDLPDTYFREVKENQKIYAEFPALSRSTFVGRIRRINSAIDPLSRTVQVEVVFPNADGQLTSGAFGRFQIEVERHSGVIIIPDNALLSRTEVKISEETGLAEYLRQFYLYVVRENTARLNTVDRGIESNGRVEIVSGLAPGDSVIVVGQKLVREGERVRVLK